jgi:hypothetical protein
MLKLTNTSSLISDNKGSAGLLGAATMMMLATFTFVTTEYVQFQTVKSRAQLATNAALHGSANHTNSHAMQGEFAALFNANFSEKEHESHVEQAVVTQEGNELVGSVVVSVPLSGFLGSVGLTVNINADASLKQG